MTEKRKALVIEVFDSLLRAKEAKIILHCGDGWCDISANDAARIVDGDVDGLKADIAGLSIEDFQLWKKHLDQNSFEWCSHISDGKRCRKRPDIQWNPSKFNRENVGLCRIHRGHK